MTADDRTLTAYHEAGHAVASAMRGDSTLVSAMLTDGSSLHRGITHHRSKRVDWPFIAWAGPWAQAKAAWNADTEDERWGLEFADYLAGAFLDGGRDDAAAVAAHRLELNGMGLDAATARALAANTELIWAQEMEQAWPAVVAVARTLLAGDALSHADVIRALRSSRSLADTRTSRR